jgi:hypothetical protein
VIESVGIAGALEDDVDGWIYPDAEACGREKEKKEKSQREGATLFIIIIRSSRRQRGS